MAQDRPTEPVGPAPRLPRAPGLDGLRALALVVIMAFHNGFGWIPGGFYSVDAFFVLSGFLITSLLIVEERASGTIRLGRFWARRARRLLPALFFMVAVLGLLVAVVPRLVPWPDPVPDTLATLFYVANWHFVANSSGYFAASAAQSPLLHTWTLAIEEQFYLVWPLVVLLVLGGATRSGLLRRHRPRHRAHHPDRRLRVLGVLSVAGALGSAAWMWWLTDRGASVNRVYYGTDTRAQALLVGAVGAVALALARRRTGSPAARRGGAVLAVAGLAGTVAVWHLVPETSGLAFRGGFLLASLAAGAIVVGVVLSPAGPVARALALRPVRYVGQISYGAYLWYWPVILVVTTQRVHVGQWGLFACRVAVTLALAAASARFVEMPIRRGSLPGWRALVGAPVAAGLALAMVVVSTGVQPAAQASTTVAEHPARPGDVRVLLVGDSMAGSLGATLAPYAARHGVDLINEGHPGCGVTTDAEYDLLLYHSTPGAPCRLGDPSALLDAWRGYVEEYRPQVVVYLARIDMFNQVHDGSWTSIDAPGFDRYLTAQLRRGLRVLGSGGARVVLATSPYYNVTADGVVGVAEDQQGRVVRYDRILREVAASVPGTTVYPLGKLVDPAGTYQGTVDGVSMRCSDFVHFSTTAGQVIAPRLLPVLARLGRTATVAPPVHDPPDPPLVPGWYGKLQCGQP